MFRSFFVQAGRLGAVTVATNMAGRGTDILLGGSSKGIAKVLAKHMMLVKLGLAEGPSPETILAYDQEVARQLQEEEEEAKALIRDTSDDVSTSTITSSSTSEGDSSSGGEMAMETDQDVLSLPSAGALAKHLGLWMPTRLSAKTELALKRAVVSCLDLLEESSSAAAGGAQPVATPAAPAGSLGQGASFYCKPSNASY